MKFQSYCVYTNIGVSGPKRSHQNPQVRFALESQLDMISEEIGIDPMELRLKNAIKTGDTQPSLGKVISCGLSECIEKSAESLNWKQKRGKLPKGRGIGMGCTYFFGGGTKPPQPMATSSGAFIKCNPDGTVNLLSGIIDAGAGGGTMLAQIAAEELGIALEDVKVTHADTDTTPVDISIHLSAATYITGNAVKIAAADVKRQLFEIASEKLEANIEDLEARNRQIYVKGSPEKSISFSDAVRISIYEKDGNPVMGTGYRTCETFTGDGTLKTGEGPWSPTYVFSNAVAEVTVDTETGKVEVNSLAIAHDCGFPINPIDVEGQLEGSASMALGQALYEEIIFDKGQALNPSFLDYKLPLSLGAPKIMPIIVESIDPKGPYGGKEAGEGSTATAVPAIANAIYDAIGIRIKELPITPEKILEAIRKYDSQISC